MDDFMYLQIVSLLVGLIIGLVGYYFNSKWGEEAREKKELKEKEKQQDRQLELDELMPLGDDEEVKQDAEESAKMSERRDRKEAYKANRPEKKKQAPSHTPIGVSRKGPTVVIAYGTQSGTASDFAHDLGKDLEEYQYFNVKVKDLKDYDPDALPYANHYLFLIVATYTEGTPTESAKQFFDWVITEAKNERAGNLLRQMKFGVFGLGNSVYPKIYYNKVSRSLDSSFYRMGAERIVGRGEGDESKDLFTDFKKWKVNLIRLMNKRGDIPSHIRKAMREEKRNKIKPFRAGVEGEEEEEDDSDDGEPMLDLEDMGSGMNAEILLAQQKAEGKVKEKEEGEGVCDSMDSISYGEGA